MDDKRAAQSPPAPPFRSRAQRDRAHRQTHRSLEPDCSRRPSRPDIRETAPTVREPPPQRSASLAPPKPPMDHIMPGVFTQPGSWNEPATAGEGDPDERKGQ